MPIRPAVEELLALGPLPDSDADEEVIDRYGELLDAIPGPVSEEEAVALCTLFRADDDETYGLAWDVLHKVETCSTWPVGSCLSGPGHWAGLLRTRAENAERVRSG